MSHQRGIRCLIAEDNMIDLRVAKSIVHKTLKDAEILEASDLDQTASTLLDASFDIALIDNDMPGGTTLEMVTMLNETFSEFLPPMIMISGNIDPRLPDQARRAGFFGFISKDDLSQERLRAEIQALGNGEALLQSA